MSSRAIFKPASLVQWIFHATVKPIFDLLPDQQRNQMMTVAHHIKMTFSYGQVMDFSDDAPKVVTGAAAVPPWVVEELYQLAEIEPDLYPTPEHLAKFRTYQLPMYDAPGRVYAACRKSIGITDPDVIFIAPWLKRGGADLGTLRHINACKKRGLRAVLITTLDTESPWLERVPNDVPVLELGRLGRELTEAEKMIVLVRLVLQTKALTIHIIQSQLGWEMLKAHGKSLQAEGKSVFASLYCDDRDSLGQKHGYARFYLASTLPYLSGIICDSAYYPAELSRCYGVDINQTHTVFFPWAGHDNAEYISSDKGKVLWASRITQQKRPDLLLKIAQAMPDVHFHVRGYAERRDEKQMERRISRLPNITFTGPYEIGGLVEEGDLFSLFLYTSAWDGLPNVLLEATLAGLPIVASSVGGVQEFINEETGYPVDEVESVEAYVSAIRKALGHPEDRYKRWSKAIDLIQKRHTHEGFFKQMVAINGYFPVTTVEDAPKLRVSA